MEIKKVEEEVINYLKPSNQKPKKYKLFGFDIETYGKYNKFLMGSLVNDSEKYVFWNKKEMIDFILNDSKIKNCRLYATNLGFDFLGLFGDSFEMLSKFEYIIRGSDFISIKYTNKNNKNILFGDTYNFLRLSVANLGNILGLKKLKKPKFLGNKPKNEKERKILEDYNIRDSYISFKFMSMLQDGFFEEGTSLKYTIASTSMNLFRNKYLKLWIKQPKIKLLKKMYNAYYGGRTEAFYRGYLKSTINEKYKLYDINSLYPYVMNKYKYPNPNTLTYLEPNNPLLSRTIIEKYSGISFVSVHCPEDLNLPLLPFRRDDKLLFPTGFFSGWYTHAELNKAVSLGYKILDVYETIYYKTEMIIFKDFVNDIYKKRMKFKRQNNKIEIMYKITLNSLYGKFAQKLAQSNIYFSHNQESKNEVNKFFDENKQRVDLGLPIRYNIDTPDKRLIKKSGLVLEEPRLYYVTDLEIEKYPKFINPIISLYITSYARIELYELFEEIERNKKKVLYCDTDSVFTDFNFKVSKKLGKLKLEQNIKDGIIVKPKFYYLNCENNKQLFKIKGLSGVKDYETLKDLLKNKSYEYIKFTKFKESLRRDLKFNEKINVRKNLDLEDNKREWNKEKINIKKLQKSRPINLDHSFTIDSCNM